MTTELAVVTDHQGSGLALSAEQDAWNQRQLAALSHIGVQNASEGDLAVFMHVCQRSGLDPFARQIYMIGRKQRELVGNEWRDVVKQTIQTGIDGFRLIGRRAADRAHHKVSIPATEWAHEDGTWRPVWRKIWGYPVAAHCTITRDGEPFTATALFDEYAQTKRDGDLTAMWAQRPAGQLAKCAEALAWRMAFPQDLSGIYTDDEMGQADNTHHEPVRQVSSLASALADETPVGPARASTDADAEAGAAAGNPAVPADGDVLLNTSSGLARLMFKRFGQIGLDDRDDRLSYVNSVIDPDPEVTSSAQMTEGQARAVIARLDADLEEGAAGNPAPSGGDGDVPMHEDTSGGTA